MFHENIAIDPDMPENTVKVVELEKDQTKLNGMDKTVAWLYRHILRDGGKVEVYPKAGKTNEFVVNFITPFGITTASLPSDGKICRSARLEDSRNSR